MRDGGGTEGAEGLADLIIHGNTEVDEIQGIIFNVRKKLIDRVMAEVAYPAVQRRHAGLGLFYGLPWQKTGSGQPQAVYMEQEGCQEELRVYG